MFTSMNSEDLDSQAVRSKSVLMTPTQFEQWSADWPVFSVFVEEKCKSVTFSPHYLNLLVPWFWAPVVAMLLMSCDCVMPII